jgi:hypothetical protein
MAWSGFVDVGLRAFRYVKTEYDTSLTFETRLYNPPFSGGPVVLGGHTAPFNAFSHVYHSVTVLGPRTVVYRGPAGRAADLTVPWLPVKRVDHSDRLILEIAPSLPPYRLNFILHYNYDTDTYHVGTGLND